MKHLWLRAAGPVTGAAGLAALGPLPRPIVVSAHRRLRGPYTAAGAVLRDLVPRIRQADPDLVQAYDLEILAAAPEFDAVITSQRETQTSTASPKTRTRYYPHAHTTRIGHGITSLLKAHLATAGEPGTLIVEHVDEADSTDVEWLAAMVRRVDPRRLRIVVRTERGELPEPLGAVLLAYADRIDTSREEPAPTAPATADAQALAARYVAADCVGDDPAARLAYEALDAEARAALHDARADELAGRDEISLRLGAIVHHRVHGSDRTAALDALDVAIEHCMMKGFYTAVLEYGTVLCGLADWSTEHERRWLATTKMATAYSVMARADEALALFDAACAASTARAVHMQSAYGRAMLFTRYFEPERRDLTLARGWINTALVIADGAPDAKRRAYNLTFNENGLALIAMHLGDPNEAMQLVEGGLDRMAAELSPNEQGQHAAVLQHNRTQLLARMGRPAEAVEQYAAVIAADPNHSDYYFERAGLLRRLGRHDEALADYDTLIRLALPYPESYYNRGDLRAEMGDTDGALADFDMVLELDPTYLDGWVNRAALRYEAGDALGAADDITAGLESDPAQPHLLSLRGVLALDDGRLDDARRDLEAALAADPDLAAAWANLGVLHHEHGDPAEAVRCYDRSLKLADDADVAMNRELAASAARVAC